MSTAPPICAILGYGPGLGAALAARFAAGGFRVIGLARDPSRYAGAPVALRAADAGEPASIAAALPEPVAVLIQNAYRATMAMPSALSLPDLAADFAVNVGGALAAAHPAHPHGDGCPLSGLPARGAAAEPDGTQCRFAGARNRGTLNRNDRESIACNDATCWP